MYLEGGDQYRGWFHSSLLIGVALKGAAPYRECATNGWTLDEHGRAMSKSLGIGVEPEEVISKYGADVLRLWVSSVDFVEDVRLSDTILKRLSEAYVKFRNKVFRNALGNLYDFNPERDAVPFEQLLEIDQWILLKTEELVAKCRAWYDEYAFHKVYRAVYDFATTDLSAVWVDIVERSPLHRRSQIALAPRRPNRALSDHLRAGSPARALVVFHYGRSLGLFVQAGRQPGQRPPRIVAGTQ